MHSKVTGTYDDRLVVDKGRNYISHLNNQSPSINATLLETNTPPIVLRTATIPSNGFLVLNTAANYFTIDNINTINRINHLLADRFPKGSVITLLFKNAGANVIPSAYIILKTGFTSVLNSSLTLISNGDGTWMEVQRNN